MAELILAGSRRARHQASKNPKPGDYARGLGPPFWGDMLLVLASSSCKEASRVDFAQIRDEAAALRRLIIEGG